MECKNCHHPISENFCQNCGQSANVGRINYNTFLSEFVASVFQIQKGFLFTIIELLIRPNTAIKNYLEGKRKPYFKPIAFVFLLSTVYFVMAKWVGSETFLGDFLLGLKTGFENDEPERISESLSHVVKWCIDNFAFTNLMLVPIFSLSTFLFFRHSKYNYFEIIVLNSYITGIQTLAYIFGIFLQIFFREDIIVLVCFGFNTTYILNIYIRFFDRSSKIIVIIKSIFIYIIYLILQLLLLLFFAWIGSIKT